MKFRAPLLLGVVVALVTLGFAAGCSKGPKSPVEPATGAGAGATLDGHETFESRWRPGATARPGRGWESFFPLDSGSVWTFDVETRFTNYDPGFPPTTTVDHTTLVTTMGGRWEFGGVAYSRSSDVSSDGDLLSTETFYRQDATGLYLFEAAPAGAERARAAHASLVRGVRASLARSADPATRLRGQRAIDELESQLMRLDRAIGFAAGEPRVPAGEIAPVQETRRLAYPLRIGRRWDSGSFPPIEIAVEGIDPILVGRERLLAYRIRMFLTDFFGPRNTIQLWYGEAGLLKVRYHLEIESVDNSGTPYTLVVADEVRRLTSYELAERARP